MVWREPRGLDDCNVVLSMHIVLGLRLLPSTGQSIETGGPSQIARSTAGFSVDNDRLCYPDGFAETGWR